MNWSPWGRSKTLFDGVYNRKWGAQVLVRIILSGDTGGLKPWTSRAGTSRRGHGPRWQNTMIKQEGPHFTLEDDLVRIQVEPRNGGKVRSFVSRKTGRNYFYVDKRRSHEGSGYSDGDISGLDECFPSIAPCQYTDGPCEGLELGDHGLLWNQCWTANVKGDRLDMQVELDELDVVFNRSLDLHRPGCLRIQYRIVNGNQEPLPFIYCMHLLLAGGPSTRFEFPQGQERAFLYFGMNLGELTERTWIDWPDSSQTWLHGPFSAGRATAAKLFTDRLHRGRAAISHEDHSEKLAVEFDTEKLPSLGILVMQGLGATARPENDFILALEPGSGIGDELETCRATGTLQSIPANGEFTFTISLGLEGNANP